MYITITYGYGITICYAVLYGYKIINEMCVLLHMHAVWLHVIQQRSNVLLYYGNNYIDTWPTLWYTLIYGLG